MEQDLISICGLPIDSFAPADGNAFAFKNKIGRADGALFGFVDDLYAIIDEGAQPFQRGAIAVLGRASTGGQCPDFIQIALDVHEISPPRVKSPTICP